MPTLSPAILEQIEHLRKLQTTPEYREALKKINKATFDLWVDPNKGTPPTTGF